MKKWMSKWVIPLLLFYILATSKVISRQILTFNSAPSWWLYSVASLGSQTASTMSWSHLVTLPRHWANQYLPYLNNAEHLARKWQVSIFKSLFCLDWGFEPMKFIIPDLQKWVNRWMSKLNEWVSKWVSNWMNKLSEWVRVRESY